MKTTLTNTVGSPFDIQTLGGPAIITAFGELTAEFDRAYLDIITAGGVLVAGKAVKPAKPAAHSSDDDEARYEAITGKKPDGRWSEERLAAELAKLKG